MFPSDLCLCCRVRSAGKSKSFRQGIPKEQPVISEELSRNSEREDEAEDQLAEDSVASAVSQQGCLDHIS